MAAISKKQREIRERERTVLRVARKLLLTSGYHGLTMARVAQAIECSKATVYQHFSCKEEMILTLATESVDKQRDLVERAATFRGRPRERMLAVGEATQLFAHLHSDDTRLFQIVTAEAIMHKVPKEAVMHLRSSGLRSVSIMVGIVRDGLVQGDLTLPAGHRLEDLVYHMWLLGEAGKASAATWLPPTELGVTDPFGSILKTGQMLGDGYGWRPLSTEWDYAATIRRVRMEVFPRESRKAYGEEAFLEVVGI